MTITRIVNKKTQYTHKILWAACKRQAELARDSDEDRPYFALTAMLMAFFTLEGYLNFIGEILCPDEWKFEKEFFSRRPYQGIKGKIKRIANAVHILGVHTRPEYQTAMLLRELRSYAVHAKVDEYEEVLEHRGTDLPPAKLSPFGKRVLPEQMERAIDHVKSFCDLFHIRAKAVSDSHEFESSALEGFLSFGSGDVERISEQVKEKRGKMESTDSRVKDIELITYDKPSMISVADPDERIENQTGDVRAGSVVWVRTPKCEEHGIDLSVKIVCEAGNGLIGEVFDKSHYVKDNNLVHPGEYVQFEIDGVKLGDRIRMSRENVRVICV